MVDLPKFGFTPDEPLGRNPFLQEDKRHYRWAAASRLAREYLALHHSTILARMPSDGAAREEHQAWMVDLFAERFSIMSGAILAEFGLTSEGVEECEKLVDQLAEFTLTEARKIDPARSRIVTVTFLPELQIRLTQYREHSVGQAYKWVREAEGKAPGRNHRDQAPNDQQATAANRRLFLDLLEIDELRTDRSSLAVGLRDKGGIIREICEASATYCSRLGREALDQGAETLPKPEFESEQGTQKGSGSWGAFGKVSTWEELEIRFLSDERVQLTVGVHTETRNYAELGFEDGRNHKPNLAWETLRSLAEQDGTFEVSTTSTWAKVERRMQEIRRVLQKHFAISADPLPFIKGNGYQACFRIHCSRSFKT